VIALDENSDDIYVGGFFNTYNGTNSIRIIRLNNKGSIDTSFDVGSGFNGGVRSIAIASDGSGDIFAGGEFSTYWGNTRNYIARIHSDGSNDGAFNVGAGFNNIVFSIAMATDGSGDIFAGGVFNSYDGTDVGNFARLDSVGRLR